MCPLPVRSGNVLSPSILAVFPASNVPFDYAVAVDGIRHSNVFYRGGRNDNRFSGQVMRLRRARRLPIVDAGRRRLRRRRRRRCRYRFRVRDGGRSETADGQITSAAGRERVDRRVGEDSAVVAVEDEQDDDGE